MNRKNLFYIFLFYFVITMTLHSQNEKSFYHPLTNSIEMNISLGSNYPLTDYENPGLGWNFAGGLNYFFPTNSENIFGIGINGGMQNINGDLNYLGLPETFSTQVMRGGLNLIYSYAIDKDIYPFISLGGSYYVLSFDSENIKSRFYNYSNGGLKNSLVADGNAGVMFNVAKDINLNVGLGYHYILEDNIDAIAVGSYKDFFLSGNIGISFTLWNEVDSDGDGINDDVDACPNEPEDIDGYQDYDGCPDEDNDGDGILDINDACQNIKEDIDGYKDDDGCPDLDNDGDGIEDIKDQCPDIREDVDGFQDDDGCPDVDNDGDGILDVNDKCPNKAEVFNGYEDGDGCPDEAPKPKYFEPKPKKEIKKQNNKPKKTKIVKSNAPREFLIHGETTFASNSAQIKSSAYTELNRIVAELKKYPNASWRIEAHVDRGNSRTEANRISINQANAILNYFVSMGLPAYNFEAIGFGDSSPIASNNTVYGRMKNRRIVIKRVN